MTLSPREIRLLCEEFSRLHDDTLKESLQRELAQRILQEPEVRKLYQRYMRLMAGLQWDLGEAGRDASTPPKPAAAKTPQLHRALSTVLHRFGQLPTPYIIEWSR